MNVCVFCGSQEGVSRDYSDITRDLGKLLVRNDLSLVYGGGSIGLMGILADEVLAGYGQVIGVIPDFMRNHEVAHDGLTELIWVNSMHERKRIMAEKADLFIALPGGWGTLDELAEILTWSQLGLHSKPVGLLNYEGYYDSLLSLFENMKNEGFLRKETLELMITEKNCETLVSRLMEKASRMESTEKLGRT